MRRRKVIAGFLWRFVLIYGLLIVPWPGFNDAYGRYFRALGRITFDHEGSRRVAHFEAVPESLHHVLDTRIALANRDLTDARGLGPVRYLELDSRGIGWVPTALILSLVLATPIPWKRRCWALVGGLVAIHSFILFSVAIHIWDNSTELSLITLGPFGKLVTDGLDETLVTQLGTSFVVPAIIWVCICLRRQDLVAWTSNSGDAGVEREPSHPH